MANVSEKAKDSARDRPAILDVGKTEITPLMIEAGVKALCEYSIVDDSYEEIVCSVFTDMLYVMDREEKPRRVHP
jgi:hypothetical protein